MEVVVTCRHLSFRFLALAAVLALVPTVGARVAGQGAPANQSRVVALRGATILTVTKGTIPNGTIVLRDGKIAALGANVNIPAGAETIDVSGKFVSPGIIDAHSHIANDSINEGGTTVSSMTGIEDVLDPTDINIYRDLGGGLTVANVLHGSANPIGGKNSVIKLRWGKKRAQEMLFEGAMPGIKFALGENPKDMTQPGQNTGPRRYPATRMGVEFVIRDAFTRAKAYQKAWQDYEKKKGTAGADLPPRRDLQLEPLVEILEGKRLVHCHSYRADEILMMIRLAEEMGFKIATFQHVLEGYKVAKEMAAHGAGGSTFSDWWGYKIEAVDAIPHNAAIMMRKGVLVSINSDSAEHARRLNTEAAKSIKWGGLTEDEAFSMVTINPAKQLRIDNRVGSLETGKDADVVVWSHHPLSTYAIVDRVYIDGNLYYERLAELRRLTEVNKEKSTLAAAERSSRTPPTANPQDPKIAGEEPNGNGSRGPSANDVQEPAAGTSGSGTGSGATAAGAVRSGVFHVAGDHQRHDSPHHIAEHPEGHDRDSRDEDRSGRRRHSGSVRCESDRRGGSGCLPGHDQRPHQRRTLGARAPRVRRRERDARPEPAASLVRRVSLRERLDSRGQGQRHHDRGHHARRRPAWRPGGVDEPRRLDVGRSDAQAERRHHVQLPNHRRRRWARWRRWRRSRRPRRRTGAHLRGMKRERDKRLDDMADLFDRARGYAKAGANRKFDWTLDALVPVVEGRLPLITTVNRAQDIRDAIAFAERTKIKMIINGASDGPAVAPLLKEKNIPVILNGILTTPQGEDQFHAATYQLAGELAQAGVKVAFSTGDNSNVRLLPYHAAMSVAWGMNRDEALKALTINAAEILGVADRVGSIEKGKDANLFIAKGDPLEIRTPITHVIIEGRDVGLANKHQALFEKYMARP